MPRAFAPLNARQLDVLRWIADGCPKGVMEGYTYKTTAVALQGRRLVEVSKRGGRWRTTITDAGVYYLAHDTYPAAPPKRGRPRRVAPPAAQGPPIPSARRKPRPTAAAKPPSPTDQLIAALLVKGEIRVTGPDRAKYEARVNAALRFGKVPEGKQLVTEGYPWSSEYVIRLRDAPDWLTATLDPVPVPKTLRRPHPVIAALRGGQHLADLDRSVSHRAFLIVQGLAAEADRRGYVVRATKVTTNSYGSRRETDDQFTITVRQHSVGVQLRPEVRRTPHQPTAAEEARAANDHWYRIPKFDKVRTDRLSIHLSGRFEHRQSKWVDGTDRRLEDWLAQVLQEIELRADAEERDRLARIAAAEERRRQWELAMDQARADYAEWYRGKVLVEQATRWRKSIELRD